MKIYGIWDYKDKECGRYGFLEKKKRSGIEQLIQKTNVAFISSPFIIFTLRHVVDARRETRAPSVFP